MENILKLGGKEFKIEVNFRKTCDLTKYRNKISMGFDFTTAEKGIVEEILNISKKQSEGKDVEFSDLSEEAVAFLMKKSEKTILSYDEIVDIIRILTGIEDNEEIESLLTAEMNETNFDAVIAKVIEAVNMVFTNAKGTSK